MSRKVRVTITLEYESETSLIDGETSYATVDGRAFSEGEFDIPEMLEWVEGNIDVKFEDI